MYLPEFWRWLKARYPLCAVSMAHQSRPLFDVLFVDFNVLIYDARAVLPNDDFDPWIAEICRILDVIVSLVKPSTLLYISADGPAPFAKNAEQRSRRQNATPSRAAMTLGTELFEKINCAVREFIERQVKTSAIWQLPNVIYSSFRTPGEGEHKFFEFVMAMRKESKWNEDAVICMCSPDPDLILQALVLNMTKCCLMKRSDDVERSSTLNGLSDFELVWIGVLKDYLTQDLGCSSDSIDNVVQDFVAITILLGNDFIPPLNGFNLDVSVMDKILDLYRTEFVAEKRWLVNGDSFNFQNTGDFLAQLCDGGGPDEEEMVEAVIEAYYFVMRYYKEGLPSWTWRYGYEMTPSLAGVAARFKDMTDADVPTFDMESPMSCLEQLVAILPPSCEELVPEPLQHLLRSYAYDPHELRREYNRVCGSLSEAERARNVVAPAVVVTHSGVEPMAETCLEINWNINFEGTMTPCVPSLFSGMGSVFVASRNGAVKLGFGVPDGCPEDIGGLVGKVILVGFPYWRPALVVGVSEAENETCSPLVVQCKAIRFTDESESALEVVDEVETHPFLLTYQATPDFMKRFQPVPVQSKQ